jgi:uncharacterized protein (DUF305 family)
MTSLTSRLAAVIGALAAALFLSSCNTPASDGHTDHTHGAEETGQPAGFNSDDVMFTSMMIPHHEQAVEMSGLVPGRSTNPDVIALASSIAAAQGPEIETMKGLLVQWNQTHDASGEHQGHGGMPGMVDEDSMNKLESLKGPEFDTLWLQSMISHHEGAIDMARTEIADGENVEAIKLANTIVDTQQAEIDQMKKMLGG